MIRFVRTKLLLVVAALATATGLVAAQQVATSAAQSAPLTQAMPVDSGISMGQFPNGLHYYVRANKKPEKRAALRLVVKAGSVLEEDDQQGLAHFVEHMAFNGTQHFPKEEVVNFMQSIGMKFGADVNAYTSFDETVFMLQVPTDKPEVLDKALLILEDWAHNVTFDDAEVDKERGVIMEEWRLRRGADARMQDQQFPILLKGSRYADRIPIGTTDVIQNFKHDRLKKFYADWYRPDLMAVIAVGDFDKAAVEPMLKSHFGSIPAAASPKPRPAYGVPDHPGTLYAIATDKEAQMTTVEIDGFVPVSDRTSIGAYRQKIVNRLVSGMLSARLSDLSQKPDSPFLMAFAGRGPFIDRAKDSVSLAAMVKDDGLSQGLDALLVEAGRVARFGFTSAELDRQKQMVLRNYERMFTERDNRDSAAVAGEYIRNFTQQETLPAPADEYVLHQRFLPEITLNEINTLARTWLPDGNRVVVVNAPQKAGLVAPDETKLAAVIKAAGTKELTAYVDTVGAQPLIETPPAPGAIAKTTVKDGFGITEWDLSNGVKVVLKPTTLKQDEIVFRATSPGGTSLASDKDYMIASSASQVVGAGGVGKFSAIDLRKVLAGKVASASANIGELDEGLGGGSSRKDLETMFQLIYLRFTQPRADPTAFATQVAQMRAFVANQAADPDFAFIDTLESTLSQNHLRRRQLTPGMIDEMNLEKSMAFYKERFADASDFTFVFVGSFDLETMKPLVERYLGSLPSIRRKETWKDIGVRAPGDVIAKRVEKGIEPKSQTAIVFNGPFQYDQAHRVAIRAMATILQNRLRETLREELGGTYSVSAASSLTKIPRAEYSFTIEFGCDPKRTEDLIKSVFKEIDKLKTGGPTDQELKDMTETFVREFETNTRDNGYLLNQISLKYQYGEDPAGLLLVPDFYRRVDVATIRDAARTYLDLKNYVQVMLFPEKK
jgi:zinc protease